MNMVDVFDQLQGITQLVRKCPTPTLQYAYMRSYRTWCQETKWLQMDIPGATAANTLQYSLGSDPQLDIVGIVAMSGSQGTSPNIQYWTIVVGDSGEWNPADQPAPPSRFAYIPESQFALNPTPDQVYQLTITVAIAPKDAAVNIPYSPLVKYSDTFEAGALEYLFSIPGMPWTDKAESVIQGKKFRAGISNGKAEVQRNFRIGNTRVRPRQFVI